MKKLHNLKLKIVLTTITFGFVTAFNLVNQHASAMEASEYINSMIVSTPKTFINDEEKENLKNYISDLKDYIKSFESNLKLDIGNNVKFKTLNFIQENILEIIYEIIDIYSRDVSLSKNYNYLITAIKTNAQSIHDKFKENLINTEKIEELEKLITELEKNLIELEESLNNLGSAPQIPNNIDLKNKNEIKINHNNIQINNLDDNEEKEINNYNPLLKKIDKKFLDIYQKNKNINMVNYDVPFPKQDENFYKNYKIMLIQNITTIRSLLSDLLNLYKKSPEKLKKPDMSKNLEQKWKSLKLEFESALENSKKTDHKIIDVKNGYNSLSMLLASFIKLHIPNLNDLNEILNYYNNNNNAEALKKVSNYLDIFAGILYTEVHKKNNINSEIQNKNQNNENSIIKAFDLTKIMALKEEILKGYLKLCNQYENTSQKYLEIKRNFLKNPIETTTFIDNIKDILKICNMLNRNIDQFAKIIKGPDKNYLKNHKEQRDYYNNIKNKKELLQDLIESLNKWDKYVKDYKLHDLFKYEAQPKNKIPKSIELTMKNRDSICEDYEKLCKNLLNKNLLTFMEQINDHAKIFDINLAKQ